MTTPSLRATSSGLPMANWAKPTFAKRKRLTKEGNCLLYKTVIGAVFMVIEKIVTKSYGTNVYICYDEASNVGVIIDPGNDADAIMNFVKEKGLEIKHILLTHGHFDHILAAKAVAEQTGAPILAHADERELLGDPELNFSRQAAREECSLSPDTLLHDGDTINFGGESFKVIATPGHTKGGVCFYSDADNVLFSGDTLFCESVGRTDLPGGDFSAIEYSIRNKLYTLPPETTVYPGHSRKTTIAHEMVSNPHIKSVKKL